MPEHIVAKFTGMDAEQHRIPAYEGTQSLVGLSRGIILVGHFLSTGVIRKRTPFDDSVRIYLRPPQEGSFEAIFQLVLENEKEILGGAVAAGITANALWDLTKWTFNRATGRRHRFETDAIRNAQRDRSGDFDALTEAVEPALKQGHTVIGYGAGGVNLNVVGNQNTIILNQATKEFLENRRLAHDDEVIMGSVGSYNANSRHGRAYVADLGRTVAFDVPKEANPRTSGVLARSLNSYANKLPSDIHIRMRRETDPEGEITRLVIYDAWG